MVSAILIGQPFTSVPAVDDAAIDEPLFAECSLHDGVVSMGVDTDIVVLLKCKLHDVVEDAFDLSAAGYAMDGGIGLVVDPRSIIDDVIGGVYASSQEEGGYDSALVEHDVAVAAGDVALELLVGGIVGCPLVGIAASCHEAASCGKNFLQLRYLFQPGSADNQRLLR